jgi:hypothetical protein
MKGMGAGKMHKEIPLQIDRVHKNRGFLFQKPASERHGVRRRTCRGKNPQKDGENRIRAKWRRSAAMG